MNARGFAFSIDARDGAARCGRLQTPHGVVATPAFMAVATFGAVRGIDPSELRAAGAEILLSNTYHLHERPGEETIARLGGLHGFTGWRGPWLTDSGGFQVTSLGDRVTLSEEGVSFASTLDGRRRLLTPESTIAIQEALGTDIAMVLDECHPDRAGADETTAPGERARSAMQRTLRWAERAMRARRRDDQAVFGIVQGGFSPALRLDSARATSALGFDGHAHGGLGLGEEAALRADLVSLVNEVLPPALPRYLMGIGRPVDLVDAIARGVDLFDCVLPTRNGRHGLVFTAHGVLALRNARLRDDARPIEEDCDCPACTRHSRAYLRHLIHGGEALGARLAALHNLRFYYRLMADSRAAIAEGRFEALRERISAATTQRAE